MPPVRLLPAVAAGLLAFPAAASAAAPSVTTRAASQVTPDSATLNGSVDPNGRGTTYFFQYGLDRHYGAQTAPAAAGAGTSAKAVSAFVGGLKSGTTYHYRIVASNPDGVRAGSDRTVKTSNIPLSLTLAAAPNPVVVGGATNLTGALAGTGGGGRTIQIQVNSFPYTGGFVAYGNQLVTNADGSFGMPVVGLQANAEFRAVTTEGEPLVSPGVFVGVMPVVRTAVSTRRPRARRTVRFAGTVTPAFEHAQVAVQKRGSGGRWVTVAGTLTRHLAATKSRYVKHVRIRHSGTYRVFVGLPNAPFVGATGPAIHIHVRPRHG